MMHEYLGWRQGKSRDFLIDVMQADASEMSASFEAESGVVAAFLALKLLGSLRVKSQAPAPFAADPLTEIH